MKFSIRPFNLAMAFAAMATLAQAGDYSTWARYRPVTLSTAGMGLSAAVTNVPISVRFKASAHADMLNSGTQVQANGSDIRVTKADGTTDVPFEIEYLSTGPNGRLHLWILADNVPANNSEAATYRVYWGKTGQTSMSAPEAVFAPANGYQAVFHLNDTDATIKNSANAALNGTATGTEITEGQSAGDGFVSAKSGSVVRRFGNSAAGEDNATLAENYIKFSPLAGNPLRNYSGPLTIEAWIYSSITSNGNVSPGIKHIVANGNGAAGGKAWFARTAALDGSGSNPPDLSGQNHYSAGGPNNNAGPIAPWGEQHHWQFVTAVWNGTSWTIYRNRENDFWNNPTVAGPAGMTPDSAKYRSITSTAPVASTSPWYVGGASVDAGDTTVMGGWQGWMDEVRISTVARDSNYVKLTFLTSRADTLNNVTHPVIIGPSESPTISGPYATWSGHRTITLNTSATGANVPGNVTHFPVLIRLGESESSIINAANGGASIRFSKIDDTTPLPYEIESWSANEAAIWVKVDTVYGNNATQAIRMHWGNGSAASESDGAAVFDTARGHRGVFHMNQASGDITDATANEIVGTNTGTTTTAGIAGPARKFEGTNAANTNSTTNRQFINLGNPAALSFAGRITMSAWIRWTHVAGTENASYYRTIINRDGSSPSAEAFLRIGQNSGSIDYAQYTTGKYTGSADIIAQSPQMAFEYPDSTVWTHLAGVYDSVGPTQRIWRLYRNGVQIAQSEDNAQAALTGAASQWRLGRGPGSQNARWFVGDMDEVRIDNVTRDSNYIKLSYQNQRRTNTLVNIGLPLVVPPGAPTGVTATADTAKIKVTWVAPANTGDSPILSYKATVVGDTAFACTSPASTLTCTITDLAPGQAYTVVVRALNSSGGGANSDASNAVTPIAPVVPGAPTGLAVTQTGSTNVTLTWVAPTATGGAAITGYTVTSNPGGLTCTVTALTCTVEGLTPGTTYTFTVVATNMAGNSPASAATNPVTTGIRIPNAFVISMNGALNPYTFRLPLSSVATTEKLTMSITDVQGKRIWSRTIAPAATKTAEITWNGVTSTGRAVAPGLYVVKITTVSNGKTTESINRALKQ